MLRIPLLISTCCLAFASAGASVPASVCSDRPPAGLALGYYAYDAARLGPDGGTTDVERFSVDIRLPEGERLAFGAAYRGTHLNESGVELQTNGYLHTFFAPVHARFESAHGAWRLSIAPALSGSSNVVKDPAQWESDAWQLLAGLVAARPVGRDRTLRYGICADHAFGDYRAYPVIGLDWEIGERWALSIGYPRTAVAFSISDEFRTTVRVAPAGNAWLVKDRALENQSMLVYEAWGVDWEVRWTASSKWQLSAVVGREFDSRYEATLANGQRRLLDAEASVRLGLRILRKW